MASQTWPGLFADDGSPSTSPRGGPLPAALHGSIYQDLRGDLNAEPAWGFENIDEALARAQHRTARAGSSH